MSDFIKREDVIQIIDAEECKMGCFKNHEDAIDFRMKVMAIPSATPQQKRGKWIEGNVSHKEDKVHIDEWQSAKCSNCGLYHTTPYMYYFDIYKYCPNCGCQMSEGGDEDDDR